MTGTRSRGLYIAVLMTALAFVLPGQAVTQEQNPQPGTHAALTAGAFSRTLTAALRQFEQAARRAHPDQGPTLRASFLRAAFTNAGVPIAFVRRFGERPAALVAFEDLSGADTNASMAPLLRGALGCEQLDSACAQRLDREFRDLLEPTARALFKAQTLFTELDDCLQTGRCGAVYPEDQRLLHEAETLAGQTDLPQVFRALGVAKANRMHLPGAIECVLTEPLDLNDCRDPITVRGERNGRRDRDRGSDLSGPLLAVGNGILNNEGEIPPGSIFLPPIEKEKEPPPGPGRNPVPISAVRDRDPGAFANLPGAGSPGGQRPGRGPERPQPIRVVKPGNIPRLSDNELEAVTKAVIQAAGMVNRTDLEGLPRLIPDLRGLGRDELLIAFADISQDLKELGIRGLQEQIGRTIAGFIDDSISSGTEAVATSIVLVPIRFAAGQTAADLIDRFSKAKDIASVAVGMFNPVTAEVRCARFGCGVFIKD